MISEKELLLAGYMQDFSFQFNPRDQYSFLRMILSSRDPPREKFERMLKAYRAGSDPQYFHVLSAYQDEVKVLTKITSVKAIPEGVRAVIGNGITVDFDPSEIADSPDDFWNMLSGYFFFSLKKNVENDHIVYTVEKVMSAEPASNVDVAKELFERALEEHALPRLLLQAFGYDYFRLDAGDVWSLLNRILPVFESPYSHRKVNIIEITNRGTGKSTTFLLLREYFNFRYYTELPSFANLIYDARNNMPGSVFVSDGLIFDEVQNWKDVSAEDVNSALSTGLENCVWSRGAGTESRTAVRQKCLPIVYSGNPMELTLQDLRGTTLHEYLGKYIVFNEALLDRIHIIHVARKKSFSEVVNAQVLYPSVARSLISLIQRNIDQQTKYEMCENLSGRRQEQAVDLQLIFQGLDISLNDGHHSSEEICGQLSRYMRYTNILENVAEEERSPEERTGLEKFFG